MTSNNKNIISDIRGTGIIEFAFIFPVFLMMVMAAIEFGIYFVKEETATRSVSTTIQAIQRDPTNSNLQTVANNSGGTIINYGQSGNYVCAKSYATYASAQSGVCTANDWSTGTPNGVTPGSPYYVAVKVNVPQSLITPLGLLLPNLPALNIAQSTIVPIETTTTSVSGGFDPSTCHKITNGYVGPGNSDARCATDEFALNGGTTTPTINLTFFGLGITQVIAQPDADIKGWSAQSENGYGIVGVYAVCCKMPTSR